MGLYFRNTTGFTLYVAFAYPDFGCSPVNYSKAGWYRLVPGQTVEVWSGFAGGTTFYYYAENSSVTRVWSGSYYTDVPNQAFDWCWDTGCTTCRNVGFRRFRVPLTSLNHIVTLATSSSQGRSNPRTTIALPTKASKGRPILRRKISHQPLRRVKGKVRLANRRSLPRKTKK